MTWEGLGEEEVQEKKRRTFKSSPFRCVVKVVKASEGEKGEGNTGRGGHMQTDVKPRPHREGENLKG